MSSEDCAGATRASGNCFKVVLLGDAGVGKTCLIQALKHDHHSWELSNEYKPTKLAWVTYFDVSDSCRLLIYDSSGRQESASLVQLYLRQLHCVIFAFALDDLSSFKRLEFWNRLFNRAFLGDVNTVSKFIIGTKMDLAWSSTELQMEAKAFAEAIGAEMWITSAATAFNTHELFTRIAERASCMPHGCFWTLQKNVAIGRKSSYLVNDNLMGKGALVRYPDPIPLSTDGVRITDILMTHQCVTMETGEGKTFKWGTWSNRRSKEAETKNDPQGAFTSYGSGSVNTLWSCVLSKAPPSTWQHENLSGEIVLGTTIRRQPTRTMFKYFKKLLFSSRDMDGRERSNRFFYMLLLTEEDSLFDCGLSSLQTKIMGPKPIDQTVVQNQFQPKPKPLHFPSVSCVSVSDSHAAVVVGSDKTVFTWGRGRGGALGLEEHLVLNFDPPYPIPVTSILNCQVSQVACGADFTLLLTSEGRVYSCGSGKMGKLGHGDETDRLLPTLIENLWNIQSIATGCEHALALTTRGALYQWGLECAHETLASFNATPRRVQQIDNVKVIAVACGTHHSVCVANGIWYEGIPYAWGKGTYGRLGLGHCRGLFVPRYIPEFYDNGVIVVHVSAGREHTGFLTKNGDVYTCGNNDFGQLGFFTASGHSAVPVKVDLTNNALEDRVTGLCCHEDYTMISTEQGNVVVWGKCFYGPKIGASVSIKHEVGAPHIIDVATCHLLCKDPEESIVELVLGLTSSSRFVLCAGITCEFDCQVMVDCKPLIPCDKAGLTALSSVGPVLVAVDCHGKCFYTNIDEWVKQLIGNDCKDLVHVLCSVLKETESNRLPPIQFKPIRSLLGNVTSVESSLSSFLFCTDVGDVYSWSPFLDGKLVHHSELNGEIVVQVACGASHFVAVTDDGALFACGNGSAGQLGHGTFESVEKFQVVSLTQFERVRNVCCGWASTVALTPDGKVFFWGQLDVPRGEKRNSRIASISTKQRISEIVPTLQENQAQRDAPPATAYKVKFTGDAVLTDKHFAIAGRPFEFEIIPRGEDNVNSSYTEFRVDSVNLQHPHDAHSKGKIKHFRTSQGAYSVSIGFHSVGVFKVCVTRNGNHILGSPFRVNVENGARVSRCKISLIGCDIECLRAVGGVLQQFIISRDLAVELWGIPSLTTDLQTHEACMLSSVTDGGIFIYVWDACYGNLSEENLNVWLHLLKLHAPSAEVLILGINCSATCANEIDMRPFQKVNPRLTQAIFTGTSILSDPKKLLDEFQILAYQVACRQELVWHKFESLASKIAYKKKSEVEILDERNMKSLAAECGIHGGFLLKQAVNFLQLVGLGLFIGTDDHFFMIQHQWLARHLTGIAKSSHRGTLDSSNLDKPKQHLVEFLTIKGMAVRGLPQGNKIDIIHFLPAIAEENWPPVAVSDYTAYRHLIVSRPPFHLYFIFQRLAAHILQLYDVVSLGKYSLVIQTEQCNCRLDLGPCLLNKTVAEIRVTVRASTQELCAMGVEHTVDQLRGLLNEIIEPSELAVKVSCNICRRQYLDVSALRVVEAQKKTQLKCAKCGDNKVSADNLLKGFKETRPFPEMIWNPFPEPSKQGTPPSLQALMTPLMRYFGEREEWQGRRLLQEIRGMMRDAAKVFADTKYYTTPRTVCLLPEFQRSSILKCNAIKMLQTWGQPKYRLFLLCEGNGDGTGVHFLDKTKHKGYLLETSVVNGLISNSVDLLRFGIQLLVTIAPLLSMSRSLGYLMIEDSTQWETLNNVLGLVGLSGAALCQVPWKSHFKEMDAFLKSFQETAKSIHQPKELSELATPGLGYQVGSESYQYLRKVLSELGSIDDFGGLRQEAREGIGVIWVCDKHSTNRSSTTAIKVMP